MKEFFGNKKEATPTQVAEVKNAAPNFTKTAIGMYKVPQVGEIGTRYVLVEIPYDPVTGATGKAVEVLRDVREDAIDKFKIKAADLFSEDQ